jgi:iron complex outermembrane receptor protein
MELALALRYDNEKRKVSNQVPNVPSSGLNINLAGQPINPAFNQFPDGIPDRSETFSETQPKITWSWRVLDNINLYASWGRGFRSGGFNSIGSEATIDFWFNAGFGGPGDQVNSNLTINDEYDKEVTDSFELGTKMNFMDNRLQLNAALFSTTIDDNQFFEFFVGPFGLMRVVTTIDEVEIQGFELDVNFAVTDNLRLYGGLGLMSSEINENINRPLSVGNDVPQTPEETYNLGAMFDIPISSKLNLTARVDYQHVGEMWFHTLQGEAVPTIWQVFFGPGLTSDMSKAQRDAYDTIDARIGIGGERWNLVLWGRNLTDEDYLQEVIPAPEFGGSFIHPSALRSYGLEATYRF